MAKILSFLSMNPENRTLDKPAQHPLIFENLIESTPFNRDKCFSVFGFKSRIVFEKPWDSFFEGDTDVSVTNIITEEDEKPMPLKKGILKTSPKDWSRMGSKDSPRLSNSKVTFKMGKRQD